MSLDSHANILCLCACLPFHGPIKSKIYCFATKKLEKFKVKNEEKKMTPPVNRQLALYE